MRRAQFGGVSGGHDEWITMFGNFLSSADLDAGGVADL
jgi:hypothetical protein